MHPRGIHLQYSFEARGQGGAEIENPLFDLLSAVQAAGSISHAAQQLQQSYRHVWGSLKRWEGVLGNELVVWAKGQPARLTPFAERLLWAERQARARMTPHVEALRAELSRVFALADDPTLQLLEVFASHDLALPQLQQLAEQAHGVHIGLRFAGSQEALRCLMDGRCTVAGFHVPRGVAAGSGFAKALRPLLRPGEHKLIGSHSRRQGLMLRAPLGLQAQREGWDGAALLRALAGGRWRLVNRQPGSGTRLLLDELLVAQGLGPAQIDGYAHRIEDTHVAVAAAVAAGAADIGLGVEAAARTSGLHFVPLVDEDYYLVCLKARLDTPAMLSLRAALASPAWAQALATLPGYAPQQAGQVLSLTRALPWWRYARPAG
ncbi:substrate-binding domain-containing protein [Rubrivivax rivuli]|uniref:LysR family transcriptional regulator n=1 Tax=Rubrivivax rivuli TaxID=1862385 RepID=A0A437RIP1_9BURK|nr:substrate-binding domain-containing protein [Rubrivivax rivuli]RVU46642.1 LysR family transcriptional regulator [Rubrivivax rivuli]